MARRHCSPRIGVAAALNTSSTPLRVALDLRIFGRRGIGRYNEALYQGLAARPDRVALYAFGGNTSPAGEAVRLRTPGYVAQEQIELPLRLARGGFDVAHFTANTAPLVQFHSPPTVVTVHDIMYLSSPRTLPISPSLRQTLGRVYRFAAFHSGTRRCDHLITVSQHTADALTRRFGTSLPPITVVHSGVDPSFSAAPPHGRGAESLAQLGLRPSDYFLHPGALDPRKNTSTVIEAFARYRALGGTAALAVMGLSSWASAAIKRGLGSAAAFAHLLPFVSNETVVDLVKGARGVVFVPSEEGFGYPLVEAMAAGTPAIVSSIDVLRELSQGAASEVPARSSEPLARAMLALEHGDPQFETLRLRGLERARHFTIAAMAEGTIAAYDRASKARSG
ncbi:MAG TPA: glycosyltransferase family 1 protein [Thermomicrobiales bacterium]|nr:glycosyltransferase family 1 protein [Thermomicrobiales bacterium]